MFSAVVFLCCLPSFLLAQGILTDIVDVARPRALSLDQANARVAQFWTSDRLKAAQLMDIKLSNSSNSKGGRSLLKDVVVPTGPQSTIPGAMPSGNGTAAGRALSSNARLIYTTGRVFWSVRGSLSSCSASVIPSKTGDLIVTAGQCVFDTQAKSSLINSTWVFVPAYYNGNAPFGIWPARRVLSFLGWTQSADYNYDVAFVALSTVNGRHIQSVVGAQSIGFNYPRLGLTYSLGYPLNLYAGQYLQLCSGNAKKSQWTQNNYGGQALSCIMGGGSGGGPWLQSVTDATGLGVVTSVNSFTVRNLPNVIHGPYFGLEVMTAWSTATGM
jgi:hypothetical protein